MKQKDIVTVYIDPVTKTQPEGEAVLELLETPNCGDGIETWWVRFTDEPGAVYLRRFYVLD